MLLSTFTYEHYFNIFLRYFTVKTIQYPNTPSSTISSTLLTLYSENKSQKYGRIWLSIHVLK